MSSFTFAVADTVVPWSLQTEEGREAEAQPAPKFGSGGTEMCQMY